MKAFTDLEQSKKLAKILSVDSADMFYNEEQDETHPKDIVDTKYPMVIREGQKYHLEEYGIPCWSLAALLDILNNRAYSIDEDASVTLSSYKTVEWDLSISNSGLYMVTKSDPIDACIEMIVKLKEKDLL